MRIVPASWGARSRLREFNDCNRSSDGRFGANDDPECGGAAAPAPPRPPAAGRPQANPAIAAEATAYNAQYGRPPVEHPYTEIDQQRAGRIADAYDALPVDDGANPEVQAAYEALADEVTEQWHFATARGMQFIPWTREGQPYATSVEMAEDVSQNNRLYFFTGGDPNAVMARVDPTTGLTTNDMFRAIHDYYGHAAGGYGFGPRGEENAWVAHSQMFSPLAQRALTTETRGQNSWVNFGRHNYAADGTYLNIPPAERPFAEQKFALLPPEFLYGGQKPTREADPPPPFVRKPADLPEEDELLYRRPPPPPRSPRVREGNPCNRASDGRFGAKDDPECVGSARVGVTSYRTPAQRAETGQGTDTGRATYQRGSAVAADLSALPDVKDVRFVPARGAWSFDGELGREPSFGLSYTGNGEARRKIAEVALANNQDAALMVYSATGRLPRGATTLPSQVYDLNVADGVDAEGRAAVESLLSEELPTSGWTWTKGRTGHRLSIVRVPQWGSAPPTRLAAVTARIQALLVDAGFPTTRTITKVRVETIVHERTLEWFTREAGNKTYQDALAGA